MHLPGIQLTGYEMDKTSAQAQHILLRLAGCLRAVLVALFQTAWDSQWQTSLLRGHTMLAHRLHVLSNACSKTGGGWLTSSARCRVPPSITSKDCEHEPSQPG